MGACAANRSSGEPTDTGRRVDRSQPAPVCTPLCEPPPSHGGLRVAAGGPILGPSGATDVSSRDSSERKVRETERLRKAADSIFAELIGYAAAQMRHACRCSLDQNRRAQLPQAHLRTLEGTEVSDARWADVESPISLPQDCISATLCNCMRGAGSTARTTSRNREDRLAGRSWQTQAGRRE